MGAATTTAEEAAIMEALASAWGARTPVAWPNKGYEPVEGTAYIEPKIARQEAFNASVGGGAGVAAVTRNPGLLTVDIRVPPGTGEKVVNGHADVIVAAFRNTTISGCSFRVPTPRPFGRDGAWYLVSVTCPYYRESIH